MIEQAADIIAVIPCLNEEQHLEGLVRKLVAHNQNLPMQIVIADGGSNDRTVGIAKRLAAENPRVLFLANPKRIQSSAVNLAVSAYGKEAKYLIRFDAHADYPDTYCQTLLEEAQITNAASVVVPMITAGDGWFQRAVAAAQNSLLGHGGAAHRSAATEGRLVDHGHHALMRIDAFRRVGGYDESFSHNEDAELDIRLGRAGYPIWLTGKTALTYYPRSSPKALFWQYVHFGSGRARTIIKHQMRPKLRQIAPAFVAPAAAVALAMPMFWLAGLPFLIWAAFCLGYGVQIAYKAKDARLLAAGPAAMIMHLGWSLGFWKEIFS